MSRAILKLQESGFINENYNKWWKSGGTCDKGPGKGESSGPHALDMENVGSS